MTTIKGFTDVGRISYTEYREPSGYVQRSYHLHVGRSDMPNNEGNLADNRWEHEPPNQAYPVQNRKWATGTFPLEGEEP